MARNSIPKYRRQRGNTGDRAFVQLGNVRRYLGAFNSPESREAYARALAEWQASGGQAPAPGDTITVDECVARYWQFAQGYYTKNGEQTTEISKLRTAGRILLRLYGSTPAREFGPLALKAVRQGFVDAGNCRKLVNEQIFRIRRLFKWCASEQLIPVEVFSALATVSSLKRGRSTAPDNPPVRPVRDEAIDAIRPFVSATIWSAVQVQRLTGMRSTELLSMRACDLDMTGPIWAYTPQAHKGEHHGHIRVVHIGPRAQEVLKPLLRPDVTAYLFDPRDAIAARASARCARLRVWLRPAPPPQQPRQALAC